jgi:hypothetical protein
MYNSYCGMQILFEVRKRYFVKEGNISKYKKQNPIPCPLCENVKGPYTGCSA